MLSVIQNVMFVKVGTHQWPYYMFYHLPTDGGDRDGMIVCWCICDPSYVRWMGACCQAAGIFPEWRDLWSMLNRKVTAGVISSAKSAIVWNSQE